MNLLLLVNRARRECGVAGGDLSTLLSPSREAQRFIDWISEAWTDVQTDRTDWEWMRKTATFATVPGQGEYTVTQTGASDLAEWIAYTGRIYPTAGGQAGEQFLSERSWEDFRDLFRFSTMRTTQSLPIEVAIKPDHGLALWPLPDPTGYTVSMDYYRIATELTVAADDPSTAGNDLPQRFHMLLVAKAMRAYAGYESAPEVENRGASMEMKYMSRLTAWGTRDVEFAGPLA